MPSVPLEARHFQDHRYWAGPTWVNTNWAIIEALRRARITTSSPTSCGGRTLALVDERGFAEYFSPTDGTGHGAPEFSWTAALTIDLAVQALDDTASSSRARVAHDLVVVERAAELGGVDECLVAQPRRRPLGHRRVELVRARGLQREGVHDRGRGLERAVQHRRGLVVPERLRGWRTRGAATATGWPSRCRGTRCR